MGFSSQVLFEKDETLPLVYLDLAIPLGYASDPEGQLGLARFTAEMMLRGSQSKTKIQLDRALDQMGATLEVEVRAEAIVFEGAVLSEYLEPFLKLLMEVLTQPAFPEGEIHKLQSETLSTIQEEIGHDASLAAKHFNRYLFHGHPYGKSALGKTKDVSHFTLEKVRAHYQKLFKNRAMILLGTGWADPSRMEAWAQELEKGLQDGSEAWSYTVPLPKNASKRRLVIVDKPDRTQAQIFGGQVGVSMTDPRFFPLYLGNHAFGGGSFSATLMVEIRVKRGWSYGASSGFRTARHLGSWRFHLFPAEKDLPAALGLTWKLLEQLKNEGITKEAFEFAQQSLVQRAGFMYNTPQKRMENRLQEQIFGLPLGFVRTFAESLQKVSYRQVCEVWKDFLNTDHLVMVVVATSDRVKAALSSELGIALDQIEVVPYTAE
jgi:zinc protease